MFCDGVVVVLKALVWVSLGTNHIPKIEKKKKIRSNTTVAMGAPGFLNT